MKKSLFLLLVLAFILSLFATTVFADDNFMASFSFDTVSSANDFVTLKIET